MAWDVEGTNEFAEWFASLGEAAQDEVTALVELLQERGPDLPYPHSTDVRSWHGGMRELRILHRRRALRILYAFDPRRAAILLLGGDKTGDSRWYVVNVPRADRLYDRYLRDLRREGLLP